MLVCLLEESIFKYCTVCIPSIQYSILTLLTILHKVQGTKSRIVQLVTQTQAQIQRHV